MEIPKASGKSVVIKNEYAGVNFIDEYQRKGLYKLKTPYTPGQDGAGIVVECGDQVTELRKGDRVCYFSVDGGSYSEYICVSEEKCAKLPDNVSFEEATAAMVQGMTAHYLSHGSYWVKKGDVVLVHAAAGGTGSILVQMCQNVGARVLGTVSSQEKADYLHKEFGVDQKDIINYVTKDFEREVKLLVPDGCHVVYDSVGKATWEQSLHCVRRLGTVVYFGNASGVVPPIDPLLLNKQGSIFLTRPKLADYTVTRDEFNFHSNGVLNLLRDKKLKVSIHKIYPLAKAGDALKEVVGRKTLGKVLLSFK